MARTLRQLAGIDKYCVPHTNITPDELEDALKLAKPLKNDDDVVAADRLKQNIKAQFLKRKPAPDDDIEKYLVELMKTKQKFPQEVAQLWANYSRLVGWLQGHRPKKAGEGSWL
jgi:hypothetical protein